MSGLAPLAVETPPCPLCESTEDGIVVGTRGRFGMAVRNIACHVCALCYQSPRPTHAAMMEYYAGEYRKHYGGVRFSTPSGKVGVGEPGYEQAMEAWHTSQASNAIALGGTKAGAKVLEIGCRHARTLAIMRDRIGIQPFGIEPGPDEAALAEAAGILCFNGTLESFEPGDIRFDQIQIFHVLEHLHDPLGALLRMREFLAPKGRVIVEVPNVHQPYGLLEENFFQNAHLMNFSAETLPALFSRAGLRVTHVTDQEVLFVVGTRDESATDLPRPFDANMLAPPRHPASWVAERLSTYAVLEKLRLVLRAQGPSMDLLEALAKTLRRPAFVPHTVSVVTDTVAFLAQSDAPRAAAFIASAAAANTEDEGVRNGFQKLAAAAAAALV